MRSNDINEQLRSKLDATVCFDAFLIVPYAGGKENVIGKTRRTDKDSGLGDN
jgi:hypothetical protein